MQLVRVAGGGTENIDRAARGETPVDDLMDDEEEDEEEEDPFVAGAKRQRTASGRFARR